MSNFINRFKFLSDYDPKRGGQLNETISKFPFSDFRIIGVVHVPFQLRTWGEDENGHYYTSVEQDFLYVWADIGRLDPKNWIRGRQPTENDLRQESIGTSFTKDCSSYDEGRIYQLDNNINNVSKLDAKYFEISPQYVNTLYGSVLCFSQNEKKQKLHNEVMSNLDIRNGFLVLKHNSSVKITDGVISNKGSRQSYSSNTDYNNYYWASKEIGPDPSGYGQYCYYCFVNPSDFYDLSSNLEGLTMEDAIKKYKYCGIVWRDNPKWIAAIDAPAKITFIRDSTSGECYDTNWNKIDIDRL